jgi:hypothetical protein
MSVNTTLAGLSQTASSNGPDGTVDPPSTVDDGIRYALSFIATLRDGKGFTTPVVLASAATTDIGAQNAMGVEISGTTTITSFGTNYNGPRLLRFTGALTLTHNASTLILPGAANITTAAGDTCIAMPKTTAGTADGWAVLSYQKASGAPVAAASQGNLLINGNFNINQRAYVSGVATTGANQYTLDRWRVVTSGQNLTFAASGNGNQVTAPAGGLEQVIEGANIGFSAAVINWVGTATCTVDGNAKSKGDAVTLTPGTNCTVKFTGGTVSQAQLENGSTPTAFQFRPVPVELALCQRYYETVDLSIVATGASVVAMSSNFVVPKRATPTFARISGGLSSGTAPDSISATATSYYFQRVAGNAGGLYSATAEL